MLVQCFAAGSESFVEVEFLDLLRYASVNVVYG